MMHRISSLLFVVLSMIALPSLAISASDNTTRTGLQSSVDGNWQLDWDRSDSFEPVMKALEVSWLMRKMAGIAKVKVGLHAVPESMDCEACVAEMLIRFKTPLSSDEIRVKLDGIARPGKDPRGRDTLDAYRFTEAGELEMDRQVVLPSGRQARLLETRRLDSEFDTLISTLVVWVDDERQASIKRTFVRGGD